MITNGATSIELLPTAVSSLLSWKQCCAAIAEFMGSIPFDFSGLS